MEGAGKGNGKEAALGETLVSPYINPPSQSAYPVWLLPATLTNSFSLGKFKYSKTLYYFLDTEAWSS